MKKILVVILACALMLSSSGLTTAADEAKQTPPSDPEDAKWIATCIEDNKNQGESAEVIKKYCECMVSKMADSETRSVTQWEKTHPQERKECDKAAGWK